MKTFALYTLARLGLFAVCFGASLSVLNIWLDWDPATALISALLAMVVSSVLALFTLRSLRDGFAADVAARAERARAAFEARRAVEDADDESRREALAGSDRQPEAEADGVAKLDQPGRP